MRGIPIAIIALTLAHSNAAAAANPTIVFNFESQTLEKPPKTVKAGATVVFRLKNINRILYDIDLKGKTLSYNSTAAPGLLALLGIQASSIGITTPEDIVKQIRHQVDILRCAAQYEQELKNILSLSPVIDSGVIAKLKERADIALNCTDSRGNSISFTGGTNLITQANEAFKFIEQNLSKLIAAANANIPDPEAKALLEIVNKLLADKASVISAVLAGQRLYDGVIQETVFNVTTSVVARNDAVQFTFTVKPAKGFESTPGLVTMERTITVPVVGNWRVNFSGGLFAARLADDAVTIGERTTTTTSPAPPGSQEGTITNVSGGITITDTVDKAGNLTHTEKGRYVFGQPQDRDTLFPGALAHVYPALGGGIQPALSVGGGTNGTSPFYVAGGSLIFGVAEKRIIFTAGLVYGKVKRLAQGLAFGQVIPDSRTEITNSIFRTGSFMSITVNF